MSTSIISTPRALRGTSTATVALGFSGSHLASDFPTASSSSSGVYFLPINLIPWGSSGGFGCGSPAGAGWMRGEVRAPCRIGSSAAEFTHSIRWFARVIMLG